MDRVSRFPALVQDRLFGFLDGRSKVAAAQVCSSWHDAMYRPCQWRHVTVRLDLDRLSEEEIASLKARGIRHAVLQIPEEKGRSCFMKDPSLTPTCTRRLFILSEFLRSFPILHSLEFRGEIISEYLPSISRYQQGLKELSLYSRLILRPTVFIEELTSLHSLQALHLFGIEVRGIEKIGMLNKTLKKLTMWYIKLGKDEWTSLLSQLSCLEELDLTFCKPWSGQDHFGLIKDSMVNLKTFTFDFPPGDWKLLNDDSLRFIAQITNLRELSLRVTRSITAEGWRSLTSLKHLNALTLSLSDCPKFSEETVEDFEKLSSLQKLEVKGGWRRNGLLRILSRGSCKLKSLRLKDILGITSDDMKHIAQVSSLRDLYLESMSVGPKGMELLNEGTFTLQSLDIRRCGVTIQGLMPLFQRQTSLRKLILRGLETPVDESTKSQLQKILPNLELCSLSN